MGQTAFCRLGVCSVQRIAMFMNSPTKRGAISLAAYAAGAVLMTMAAAWSTIEVGATLIRMTNHAIIDGSGRAESEIAPEPMIAIEPERRQAETQTRSEAAATVAIPRTVAPPTRVSSDTAGYDYGSRSHSDDADEAPEMFRTYCVRLCDGYYWPLSFSTSAERLGRDSSACQSSCDSPARLFVHRVSRGGPGTMVSLEGLSYTSLKTAFLFRSRFDATCRCKPQPWDEAATNRHRLFAANEAARKGNRAAAVEARKLSAKVEAERAQVRAARDAANIQANRQLATLAGKSYSEHQRRERAPFDNREAMGLGMSTAKASRGGFVPASGSGRAWTDRVFGDN